VLPIGVERLRADVDRWRRLAARGRTEPRVVEQLAVESAALFDALAGPAAAGIARHERLLVVPDGPLHLLPFSALAAPAPDGAARRYLVEAMPVHHIVSFTVAAQERSRAPARARPGAPRLVSFGAPLYPSGSTAAMDARVRSFVERSATLAPLPGAQREVTGLLQLFGDRGRAFVGAEATEPRARTLMPEADYVHLAVHGWLNETFPMNSALVFTIPDRPDGEANGLLQAWEVMDHLTLDADLVVLSACDTGIGTASGGDGLLGLSRAFHFAGARSVVASLWPIADDTTPRFMQRFYRELTRGVSKDRALAAAQREMLADPSTAHPYFWAAFVLSGAWT
jgi:CHAT domain-containing protein